MLSSNGANNEEQSGITRDRTSYAPRKLRMVFTLGGISQDASVAVR